MELEIMFGGFLGGVLIVFGIYYCLDKYFGILFKWERKTNEETLEGTPISDGLEKERKLITKALLEATMSKEVEPIDLSTCEEGDILVSSHGTILMYVSPTEPNDYYDHIVTYMEGEFKGSTGTRTNDGYVMKLNRKPKTDHDIVRIIKKIK